MVAILSHMAVVDATWLIPLERESEILSGSVTNQLMTIENILPTQ